MFFEDSENENISLKELLNAHGLMSIDNLTKAQSLGNTNQYAIFLEVLAQCHSCEEGSYQLNQACFDKLIETVQVIDIQNSDPEDGLFALAGAGLLNEETLKLFAANPSAFNDESKFSDEKANIKDVFQDIIDEQKRHISAEISFDSLANESPDNQAKFLLEKSGLDITSNLIKINKLSKHLEYPVLIEVLAQCHYCEEGSYHLDQTSFDKLVETVQIIDMQNSDNEGGLLDLASYGLLNEETLELFAANPSAFNDESRFSGENSNIKDVFQEIIDEQKSNFRPGK